MPKMILPHSKLDPLSAKFQVDTPPQLSNGNIFYTTGTY